MSIIQATTMDPLSTNRLMFDDFHGFRIDTLLRLANAEPALSDALRSALVLPTTAAETAGPDLPGVER